MEALNGLRVVNTRPSHQAGELNQLLRAAGATPLPFPCSAIEPVAAIGEFDQTLVSRSFDWIFLTSQNSVEMLALRARAIGLDRFRLTTPRYAVVGPVTAAALQRQLDIEASFIPDVCDAETMASEAPIRPGDRVLMPVSDISSDIPAQRLIERGAEVTRMVIYRTRPGHGGVDLGTLLQEGTVGAITFTSSSAVSGFVARLKHEQANLDDTRQIPIACIGPHTRNHAISKGMLRAFCPPVPTLPGLLEALAEAVTSKRLEGRQWG